MPKHSEDELIILFKKGSWPAFNTIFNRFYSPLYFYCRKFISDPEEVKDILQNVFLRFWEKRRDINIEVSLNAYLFRSVHNECLNHLRGIRPNLSLTELESGQLFPDIDGGSLPDEETESREIERTIDLIIETLPEQCKKIFIMSRMQGLKNKEIAEQLSVSVRTVDTQIYRAVKVMKKGLKDYLK